MSTIISQDSPVKRVYREYMKHLRLEHPQLFKQYKEQLSDYL